MLRVNLAGEYGAKRIYEGQLAVLKNRPAAEHIEHMKQHELGHLEAFEQLVVAHRVRPTLLSPLWHIAGYALGMGTALMGEKAAMACTVAVEEVIDGHYEEQLIQLGDAHPQLKELIQQCQKEEKEHRDLALQEGAKEVVGYPLLSGAIKTASRIAIWLSKRV